MERNKVVLVDSYDNAVGEMEKLMAHQQGILHRAFSVFIFDDSQRLLLQQRADHKYHGARLWTNTCCSHPQWEEDVALSAKERLTFEMGIISELKFSHSFIYRAEVENGLIEYEYDYVFVGYSNQTPIINPSEVRDFKWMTIEEILEDVVVNSERYTYWFKVAFPMVVEDIRRAISN